MRKLLIGLLAVVFVLGMSSGVMAETATDLSEGNASDEIGVTLDVGEFADVSINQNENLLLEPTEPGIDDYEKVARDHAPVTIHANTDVNVAVQENLSSDIKDEIGREYVEAFQGDYPKNKDDFLNGTDSVGIGAWLVNETEDNPPETGNKDVWRISGNRQGAEYSYNFETTDDEANGVTLESSNGVVFDGYIHTSMVWYGQDWQELESAEYTGDITVTVSAN